MILCSFFVLLDLKSDLKIVVVITVLLEYSHVMTFSTCHNLLISIHVLIFCDCARCQNSWILTHYNLHSVIIENYEMKK